MRYILFLSLIVLASCSGKTEEKTLENSKGKIDGALDAEMKAIDADISTSGQVATSMRYTKNEDVYIVVNAHLNAGGKFVKIEEDFNDGAKGNNGKNSFYLKDDKVFATRAYYSDMQAAKPAFVDRITYYDKNEKAIKSIEKRVDYEEDLDQAEYVEVKTVALSIDRARRVLDQKGEFETTFQGFIDVNPLKYIIIGEKNSNGYVSSIRVDYEDDFIKMLLKDQNKYMNRKIFIQFENVVDPTGMQYQSYLSGKILD
ncbi:MAG: hypothetical protein ACK5B9_00635 [Flavobacteriia bacterium]|jgi:hypothetical protein